MTLPRQILPGSTYLVTRRCAQRELLLKPTARTTAIFKYVLAVAAKRYGIRVHAACVMGNHYHLVVTDPRAALPRFSQLLDAVLARALNHSYGRWESFWAPGSYSAVRLETPEDVLEKIVYTLANPVSAGLVAHGREWPGLWSPPERIGGGAELVPRPGFFFSKKGSMPEQVALSFTVPKGLGTDADFRVALERQLTAREEQVAQEMADRGERFQGVRCVLKQKHTDRPVTDADRRGLRPRVAARDKWRRMEALGRIASFLADYREALHRLRRGDRDVIFPYGTYLVRVHLRVACRAA
jgi:REP element-mobilizing transposase RayT